MQMMPQMILSSAQFAELSLRKQPRNLNRYANTVKLIIIDSAKWNSAKTTSPNAPPAALAHSAVSI